MDVLQELSATLRARKDESSETSYVASLYQAGTNKILEKVGEEATEVILAAKDLDTENSKAHKDALAGEVADLWFHSMVMLAHLGMSAQDVLNALESRTGISGHVEKANRTKP